MTDLLLRAKNVCTYFHIPDGIVKAVDGVDLELRKQETLGVVGESGSGKSVTALTAMGLIPNPPGKIISGEIDFLGEDLLKKSKEEMRVIRGSGISMIFQNPYLALNPLILIGNQIIEVVRAHKRINRIEAAGMALEMLHWVGIETPKHIMTSYPFDVSAGNCQRAILAMALLCRPRLLIADEPTTLLDAIAQVEVLTLIRKMKEELKMSIWYISHDFGAIALMSERIMVMYAGKSVEEANANIVLKNARHPYSVGLINSVPVPGKIVNRLLQIPGEIPDPLRLPEGCSFNPRCEKMMTICQREEPPTVQLEEGHSVRCWLYATK